MSESEIIALVSQHEYEREVQARMEEDKQFRLALEYSLQETSAMMRETTEERRLFEEILELSRESASNEERERLDYSRLGEHGLSQSEPLHTMVISYPQEKREFLKKGRHFLQRKLGVKLRLISEKLEVSSRDPDVLQIAFNELGDFISSPSPHHLEEELASLRNEIVHVFVDNSNIYIGAQNVRQLDGSFVHDLSIRCKVGAIKGIVANHRRPFQLVVFGSKPPSSNGIWEKWREAGFQVHCEERAHRQREHFVDDATVAMINAAIIRYPFIAGQPRRTLVLLTGDGNINDHRASFVEAVENALRSGWKVELWTWKKSVSVNYLRMLRHYADSGLFSINYLDEFRDIITFTSAGSIPTPAMAMAPVPLLPIDGRAQGHPPGPPIGNRGGRAAKRGGRGAFPPAFNGRLGRGGRGAGRNQIRRPPNPIRGTVPPFAVVPAVIPNVPMQNENHEGEAVSEPEYEIIEADINIPLLEADDDDGSEDEDEDYFYMTCPITLAIFEDPVRSPYGHYFERSAIIEWIQTRGPHCPFTRNPLNEIDLIPADAAFLEELAQRKQFM